MTKFPRFLIGGAVALVALLSYASLTSGAFTDLSLTHKYFQAIDFISQKGIVKGYPDGSYQPERTLNRAELLKIIVEANYTDFDKYDIESCFKDIPAKQWYTRYVCFGKKEGIVEGYTDNTFRPAQKVNFVEALKIVLKGFKIPYDDKANPWYRDIIDQASGKNVIPLDVAKFDQEFSRGQMAELITRILKYNSKELDVYLGTKKDLRVTFDTITAGTNVELKGASAPAALGKSCSYQASEIKSGASFPAGDGCNTCTCTDGAISCTAMLCVDLSNVNPGGGILDLSKICNYEGKVYGSGDNFLAKDGCNTCVCKDGKAECTTNKLCIGGAVQKCQYGGKEYGHGENYPATDGCNTCLCDSGTSKCTQKLCLGGIQDLSAKKDCQMITGTYKHGESFPDADGCNTCVCNDGNVSCSSVACMIDLMKQTCAYQGTNYAHGSTFPAGDNCNTCHCDNGNISCTMMYCLQ